MLAKESKKNMSKLFFIGWLSALIGVAAWAGETTHAPHAGFDLFLIRHAETMGNLTGVYTEESQREFSPKGHQQVAGIARKLAAYQFDDIVVSPTYRVRRTMEPFLRAAGRVAEIWPELEECCCDVTAGVLPAADVPRGAEIVIEDELRPHFRWRDPDSTRHCAPTNMAEGAAQYVRACEELKRRFGHSGRTVLVATHGCIGSRLIEYLLGLQVNGRFPIVNAAITHLRQRADGTFELMALNDADFKHRFVWKSTGSGGIYEPGQPATLRLAPEFFMPLNARDLRVEWRARTPAGRIAAEGGGGVTADEKALYVARVDTVGAQPGDTWTFHYTVLDGGAVLDAGQLPLFFPDGRNLAGVWRVQAGDNAAWAGVDIDDSSWPTSAVPGNWENDALANYDGTAWYRLRFTVSSAFRERWGTNMLALVLGAVDDADETFLNGEKIGAAGQFPPAQGTAWDQPRCYVFAPDLLQEENLLAVRVADWMGGGGIWRGPVAIGPADAMRR